MRIAMVGAGGIVQKMYLPLLRGWPGVQIVGLTSRRPESFGALAARFGVPPAESLQDLFARNPDLVLIHSSTETHGRIAAEALERGIPVFVDKPLAYDQTSATAVLEVAARTRVPLFVGFNRRFAPLYVAARRRVGDPGYVLVEKHRRAQWFNNPRETIFDDFIHPLDTLVGLAGPVRRAEMVVAGGKTLITAEAALGKTAVMHRGIAYEGDRLTVAGARGRAEVEELERLRVFDEGGERVEGFGPWQSIAVRRGFQAMLEAVFGELAGNGSWPVTLDELDHAHAVAEALCRFGRYPA